MRQLPITPIPAAACAAADPGDLLHALREADLPRLSALLERRGKASPSELARPVKTVVKLQRQPTIAVSPISCAGAKAMDPVGSYKDQFERMIRSAK